MARYCIAPTNHVGAARLYCPTLVWWTSTGKKNTREVGDLMSTRTEFRAIVIQEESEYGPYIFTGLTYQAAKIMQSRPATDYVPIYAKGGTWRVQVESRSVSDWTPYRFPKEDV